MSKSVTGQDVEDMLSSVRRLVSSELPRNRRTRLPEAPEALVLTAAQRVKPSMIGHNSRRKSLENRIAELEAAVSETADEWEPDGSEDQAQHRPDRIVYKPVADDGQGDRRRTLRLSEIALIETGPANDDADGAAEAEMAAATFRHGADEEESRWIAAEEELVSEAAPVEARSADTKPTEVGDIADIEVPGADAGEAQPDQQVDELHAELEAEAEDEPVDDIATDEAFEEALAEAVAASLPEAVAEEIDTRDDNGSPEHEAEPGVDDELVEADEASVRPLVATLIREELQGELGERITRNVRKLVRQEIQRALTVREME